MEDHTLSLLSDGIKLERGAGLVMILDTPKGRGIFTTQNISAGSIVDVCPALVISTEENETHIRKTELYHYTYNWPLITEEGKGTVAQAVVFGLGSMFNHAREPNIGWIRDLERFIVMYKALRDIAAGEELCISYGDRLTFKDADAPLPLADGDGSEILNNIHVD